MADKFTFSSAGEAQEVEFALARHNWTHPLLKKATSGDYFGLFREVLEGNAEICRIERFTVGEVPTVTANFIDCDATPTIPSDLYIEEKDQLTGRVLGQLAFDPANVTLYLSQEQQGRSVIKGHKFWKELANKAVLPANVLDYLLENPNLIPDSWKGKVVFFFGTVYRNSIGSLFVRCLFWVGERWYSRYRWLGYDWYDFDPAALRAS